MSIAEEQTIENEIVEFRKKLGLSQYRLVKTVT